MKKILVLMIYLFVIGCATPLSNQQEISEIKETQKQLVASMKKVINMLSELYQKK